MFNRSVVSFFVDMLLFSPFNRVGRNAEVLMNQLATVYDMRSAVESLEPWLEQHLPNLDPVARRRFTHLVTGIIEQQSLLVKAIAAGSVFQATPESNFTQVQRIIPNLV